VLNTKTVFILGAGASKPYGLPLGTELYETVLRNFGSNSQSRSVLLNTTSFGASHVDQFVDALRHSGLTSVDAFLEHRTEFIDIGKAAMAIELFEQERHAELWGRNNWMQYLYARMVTNTLEEFAGNKISFVTYNYDRSLEHFMFTALRNTYGEKEEKCAAVANKIGLIHLHGQLAQLPWQDQRKGIPFGFDQINAPILQIAMDRIKIVHEDILDRDKDFDIARRLLWEAKRIYFMGFSYGSKNIERLKFEQVMQSALKGTALGMQRMEIEAAISQLGNKVELQGMECLLFLREVAALD
jgi:hypothetical protein